MKSPAVFGLLMLTIMLLGMVALVAVLIAGVGDYGPLLRRNSEVRDMLLTTMPIASPVPPVLPTLPPSVTPIPSPTPLPQCKISGLQIEVLIGDAIKGADESGLIFVQPGEEITITAEINLTPQPCNGGSPQLNWEYALTSHPPHLNFVNEAQTRQVLEMVVGSQASGEFGADVITITASDPADSSVHSQQVSFKVKGDKP